MYVLVVAVVAHTDAKSIKAAVAGGDGPGSISLPADNGTSCNTQACDEHPTVPTMSMAAICISDRVNIILDQDATQLKLLYSSIQRNMGSSFLGVVRQKKDCEDPPSSSLAFWKFSRYVSELHDKRVRDIGIQDELNSAVTVEGDFLLFWFEPRSYPR